MGDQNSEFSNQLIKQFLENQDITIYSKFGERNSAVIERVNLNFETEYMWKYIAENTSNWINVLHNLIKKYSEAKDSTTTPLHVEASKEENEPYVFNMHVVYTKNGITSSKYKVGNNVRIFRVKGMVENGYLPNWSEEIYKIVNVETTTP